jgi:uncharacterized protein YukE
LQVLQKTIISMTKHFFKLLLVLFMVNSVSAASPQNHSTSEWQVINVEGLFTFRLPKGFVRHKSNGADNTTGEFVNGQTKLLYVWGGTRSLAFNERQQKWMNDYQETITRIRGKRANIRSYWQRLNGVRIYKAELNVGNWQNGEVELFMAIEGRDPKTPDFAKAVFTSVTFPIPTPERRLQVPF